MLISERATGVALLRHIESLCSALSPGWAGASAQSLHAPMPQLASAMIVTITMGGMMMYGARSMWERMEPWLFAEPVRTADIEDNLVSDLYGVDVSESKFFQRESVNMAVKFAAAAHAGQIRKTRQPYITHCIETALIVEALLSTNEDDDRAEAAVIAALLHDVIDDTDVDPEEVYEAFGDQVGSMVTKVSQLSATNQLVRRKLRLEHR